MIRTSFAAPLALAACLLALSDPGSARGAMVDYTAQGTFTTTSPLTVGGITATAASGMTLNLSTAGLGVVGGQNDPLIDASESVLFRFTASPATSVSFTTIATITAPAAPTSNLEGFDASGQSLGIATFSPNAAFGSGLNVSSRFGGVALSAFRVFGNGSNTGLSIARISFTPNAVPEPSSLALVGAGLASILIARQRRRPAIV